MLYSGVTLIQPDFIVAFLAEARRSGDGCDVPWSGRDKCTFGGNTVLHCQSVLFLSRPRSEGWPHHGRTFSTYLYPLSF